MGKRKFWLSPAVLLISAVGLVLCHMGAAAQSAEDITQNPDRPAVAIPKEYIPTYFCVLNFFELPANVAYTKGGPAFGSLLELLGIESDSPLKDTLIETIVSARELYANPPDLRPYINDDDAWMNVQLEWIGTRVQTLKTLYDTFLDECEDEGLDRDQIKSTIESIGRVGLNITLIGEMHTDLKGSLRQFEAPTTSNPWLE